MPEQADHPATEPREEVDADTEKEVRLRQQAALAQFGELALRSEDLDDILTEACRLVGNALGTDLATILEAQDDRCSLLVKAGFGLKPGIVGRVIVAANEAFSSEGRTLKTGGSVVLDDIETDTRFAIPRFLVETGVKALVNVVIIGGRGNPPYGVLQVDSRVRRRFSESDVTFLQTYANLVAAAVDRLRALQDATRERDQLWTASEDLLIVFRTGQRMLRINPAWTRLLGISEEELTAKGFVDRIFPADFPRLSAAVHRVRNERSVALVEGRLQAADGSLRWISWKLSPAPDGVWITGVGRDITEDKQRQEALYAAEEALRQSQKMEAVGQLTGGVAHDFNNLLTVIQSSVDLLKRPNISPERQQRYIEAISSTAQRAAKLTSQLLAFSRRQALMPEVFDVGAKLSGIGDMINSVTGARITVTIDVPDSPCFVRADVSQFETALVNLAVNARDAMDGHGTLALRLRCADALPPIRGHAGAEQPFAAVSMTDTGLGIASDTIARIFEPFFTTKDVGKGTGLGLSQVFGFTKQSGGDVDVSSEPGCGTTFTLYLPEVAQEPVAQSRTAETASLDPGGTGQRVLVVEDNVEVGRFATQLLQDLGYRPTLAANGEIALETLGADGSDFDVVFSDVVMPGMGGIALAQELRRRLPRLPVVLASGYSHVLAEEGTHGFELLHKPYSADQIGRALRRVVARGTH